MLIRTKRMRVRLTIGALALALAAGVAGCDGSDSEGTLPGDPLVQSGRDDGKRDSAINWNIVNKGHSCSGYCGSIVGNASGYCGCDEQCVALGDCCSDKSQSCQTVPGGLTITSDQQTYTLPAGAIATVSNQGPGSAFIGGCGPVSVQRLEGGQWIDEGSQINCVWEGLATEIKTGESISTAAGGKIFFRAAGTWRLAVRYGIGCTPSKPLSQAGCSSFDTAVSEPITVKPAGQFCGGIAGIPCPAGQQCVDDPSDTCDPNNGGADCSGICQAQFCGGFGNIPCPAGLQCVDDPSDTCDPNNGGADCGGICEPAANGDLVFVAPDKFNYSASETATATVTSRHQQPIFLSGCTQTRREQLVGGQWIDRGRNTVCLWEGLAVEVQPHTSFDEPTAVQFNGPGTWRLAARYGLGCTANKPLSGAGCTSFETVVSNPITVTP